MAFTAKPKNTLPVVLALLLPWTVRKAGKWLEFALDNDLAIERKRYYESEKSVLIDGIENLVDGAEEKECIKSFNRKKFNRRLFGKVKAPVALGKIHGSYAGK